MKKTMLALCLLICGCSAGRSSAAPSVSESPTPEPEITEEPEETTPEPVVTEEPVEVKPTVRETIQEREFQGDTTLWDAGLNEGLKRIESLAFADSSVKRVFFPSSLEYIAPDAFSGCSDIIADAEEGTAGYTYALSHPEIFYLILLPRWQVKIIWQEYSNRLALIYPFFVLV